MSFLIEFCPYCNTKLIRDGVHIACPNEDCPETNIQKITAYCKDCEMDGVSEATVRLLYEHDFIKSILDLYELHTQKNLLMQVDGLGDSKIDNLFKQIEKSKKQNIVQFVARLNIKSVGERAVKNLGIDTRKKFLEFKDTTYVNGKSIIEFREKNKDFIDKLLTIIEPTDIIQVQSKGKVAMTGSGPRGRKELERELAEMGYEPTSSISKDTTILLCEDPSSGSSKLQKAHKLGIAIKAYSEFFK
jgi:DNA ligase (NAD+)